MSSEFITTQPKAGTVYRFIRVPEISQNANTVVLIKNSNQTETSTIAKVQKHVPQAAPAKILTTTTESSGGKKVKTLKISNGSRDSKIYSYSEMTTGDFNTIK